MEEAEDCIVCTTGMAACTMIYLTYLKSGDHLIIFHDVYGAHYKVSLILERMGIDITWLDASAGIKSIREHIKPNTKMILCETPSNPLCKVVDIRALRKEADKVGAMVVVDNTFATPFHQKPLQIGADLVVHSATKGLGGHNDLMAGAIAGSKEHYNNLWFTRQAIGTTLDAYSGSLLERGLKTFDLRAETMSANALVMAEFLEKHPKITQIYYPGLKSDPGYKTACKQMNGGFGGVLAFDVGEDIEEAKKFIDALEVIIHAVSLGATETLICIPYLTTMLYLPEERRTTFGVKKNTVRLSAGIEKSDILLEDLKQALDKI
jgi:cystathionine gamma-lyase/homocysteine desulfhydrase